MPPPLRSVPDFGVAKKLRKKPPPWVNKWYASAPRCEHRIGEVVVLIDQHVLGDVVVAGVAEQLGELRGDGRGLLEDPPQRRFREEVGMALQRRPAAQ